MKSALLTGALHESGELFGEAWVQKKRMSPLISNARIGELYDLALSVGALGGKITGAGGGGYILLFFDFTKSTMSWKPLSLPAPTSSSSPSISRD